MRLRDLSVREKQASESSYEHVEEINRVAIPDRWSSCKCDHPGRTRLDLCQPLAAWRAGVSRAGSYTSTAIFRSPRRRWLHPGSSAVLLPARSLFRHERCVRLGNLEDL